MPGDNPAERRFRARVVGRVQGVGFRYYVVQAAAAVGASGWVRNRWDGSVEVLAEGEPGSLARLLTAVRKGPRGALVADVDLAWEPATGEFKRFSIRRTA